MREWVKRLADSSETFGEKEIWIGIFLTFLLIVAIFWFFGIQPWLEDRTWAEQRRKLPLRRKRRKKVQKEKRLRKLRSTKYN